jgi:hypothetical protein
MDVAKRVLRVNTFRYWQIEHGYAEPRPHEIRALARFFHVAPAVMFPHLAEPQTADAP